MRTFLLFDSRVSNIRTHRAPIVMAAKRLGYDVHVTALVHSDPDELSDLPVTYHPIGPSQRTGGIKELRIVRSFRRLLRETSPEISHFASLRAVLWGLIATHGMRDVHRVSSITGLGFLFIDDAFGSRLQRQLVGKLIARFSRAGPNHFIFQNEDDKAIFESNGWSRFSRSVIVPGSGVDVERFAFSPIPMGKPIVLFPARYLVHKGVNEFIAAAEIVKQQRPDVMFQMVGGVDLNNPACVSQQLIDDAVEAGIIEDLGYQREMPQVMASSSIVCLPSYREGLPKALIEGASTGRPIVATDVAGCRDVVRDGVNGYLCRPFSGPSLAQAILKTLDRSLPDMGRESRRVAVDEYSAAAISSAFESLYDDALR